MTAFAIVNFFLRSIYFCMELLTKAGYSTNFAWDHILILLGLLKIFSHNISSNWLRKWSQFFKRTCPHSFSLTEFWEARVTGKVTNPVQNLFKFRVSLPENTHAISHITGTHSTSIPRARCWLCRLAPSPWFFLAVFRCNCKVALVDSGKGDADVAQALFISSEAPSV